MFKQKVILSSVLCLLISLFAGVAFSGFGGGGPGGGGPGGGMMGGGMMGGGGDFDPNAMRQMMEDNTRNQIGATAEQWKEMGPIVMKIQQLNQQLAILSSRRMGGMMGGGMMGGGMMGGGPGAGAPGAGGPGAGAPGGGGMPMGGGMMGGGMMGGGAPTALSKAVDALRTTLQDTAAKPDAIKGQLTTVRAERKKVEDEIKTEQDKLAKIVASRQSQEAQLVLMGILK